MTQNDIRKRRGTRYSWQKPVLVRWGRNTVPARCGNVSPWGLLLRVDHPPPARHLIRIDFGDLLDPDPLSLYGMVVHSNQAQGAPQTGIELYANARPSIQAWEKMVESVKRKIEPLQVDNNPPGFFCWPMEAGPYERFAAIFEMRPPTTHRLIDIYTECFTAGGMFLKTPLRLRVGEEVLLHLQHPETKECFNLIGVVRRAGAQPFLGVRIELLDIDDLRRLDFWNFVSRTIDFA
ncbi:MAG: hypothetical protein R3C68_08125 [Myxococcota bacterium]